MLASCLWCVGVKFSNKGDGCWEMFCQLFCLVSSVKCPKVFLQLIYMDFNEWVILRKRVFFILSRWFYLTDLWASEGSNWPSISQEITQSYQRQNKKKKKKKHETFLSWPFNHLVTPYLGIRWRVPRFLSLFFLGFYFFFYSRILSIKFCNHLPLPLTVTSLFCSCFSTLCCRHEMYGGHHGFFIFTVVIEISQNKYRQSSLM